MRNFLIKLLGGKTEQEYADSIKQITHERSIYYIHRAHLDYASTLLKRWNEYRGALNMLAREILNSNPNYFKDNQSLFFDIVLQDYYFRRLFLLQYKIDFFERAQEQESSFYNREFGVLGKVFWEQDTTLLALIHSDNYLKDWNKI